MKTYSITCGKCGTPLGGTVTFPDTVMDGEQRSRRYLCKPCSIPVEDPERAELENEYLLAARDLITLSTGEVPELGTKLTAKEYKEHAVKASKKDLAATVLLLSTLQFTFFQMKIKGWAWDDIQWHGSPP